MALHSYGWRNLVGCSPLGHEESDTTERLHFHFSLSSIGEGNGNPLQCSCLENPRDGGTWWAAVYGVTQLDTTEVTWQQQQQSHNKPLVESLFLTRNQAQSFWSRSTDSKTLDNQRTNLREYQIVRTHTKKTT